ncbi:hypothetical protein KUTeg_021946 [Tegillarca granosa]|uniref:C1q domain-containing protein n=1 Tax=Tegillarca granosa TaxID=220873 RepID=A0ABQ9E567_TEGGR|nr:hypothetical protein KUTeg_021946 [Tegillarca granosa]
MLENYYDLEGLIKNKIAFTAGIPKSKMYSGNQIIKFAKVITNVGGGLNASDGVFYCPEPALYYFYEHHVFNRSCICTDSEKRQICTLCWVDTRVDVIQSIVDAKVKQVKEFRDKLLTVKKGVTFVESTYDNFWGSGLNESGTKHTKPASWPGMNMFGKVLTKTADKLKRPGSVSVTGRS